jgi:hypothetical protein
LPKLAEIAGIEDQNSPRRREDAEKIKPKVLIFFDLQFPAISAVPAFLAILTDPRVSAQIRGKISASVHL